LWDKDACTKAIQGEEIPQALGLPLTRLCVVRGIRHHDGYGKELYDVLHTFARALNSRSIMSGCIPEIKSEAETPYCIWHPQIASEDTYRRLVQVNPHMVYQVGRACAVAGYLDLYKELDVLPEVHIAEEARECGHMEVYDMIMSEPVRYDIMNDYACTVASTPVPGAYLNGDTAVYRSLKRRQSLPPDGPWQGDDDDENSSFTWHPGYEEQVLDITEDQGMDLESVYHEHGKMTPEVLDLLTSPLPRDLPIVDKDVLVLMAAYNGDIDRYVRLRRPSFICSELQCCIRGIFHNTMFALWWSREESRLRKQEEAAGEAFLHGVPHGISTAISARKIMNNCLDRMMATTPKYSDPYLIWYPSVARESTYRKLYELRPSMAPQIMRACIEGGYTHLFSSILASTTPSADVASHAQRAGEPFSSLTSQRISELGGQENLTQDPLFWKIHKLDDFKKVSNAIDPWPYFGSGQYGIMEGYICNAENAEVFACLPESWRYPPERGWSLDYEEWPPAKESEDGREKEEELGPGL
jgi:hypothetical protein